VSEIEDGAVAATEADVPAYDPAATVLDEAQDRERRGRLSRTGLSDDGDGLASLDLERQPADRVDDALGRAEADAETLDREQRGRE